MPKSHQAHLEWTPSRLIHWAERMGAATALVVRTRARKQTPSRDRLPRLSGHPASGQDVLPSSRLEAASKRALELQACSYQSLKSILKRSLDRQLLLDCRGRATRPRSMKTCAGPNYYNPPTRLLQ